MKMNELPGVSNLPIQGPCMEQLLAKYGHAGETSVIEIQQRVAHALANNDEEEARYLRAFQNGMIPAGRINSAAGRDGVVTMINCFVQPISDTMSGCDANGVPGIMEAMAQAAETMRRGGGVGYDFSPLRPMGALVKGTDSAASGPVSYMTVFDTMCKTVESAGARRGAQMAVLRVDHPDVELFIEAKRTPEPAKLGLGQDDADALNRILAKNNGFRWNYQSAVAALKNFNLSVGLTDDFMRAVEADANFDLVHTAQPRKIGKTLQGENDEVLYVYKTVKARVLFDAIMSHAFVSAEPGCLFVDTINRVNNLRAIEKLKATNPCGEQPLPPYGCCDLAHNNLALHVRHPFTPDAYFDYESFGENVAVTVDLLDTVLDKSAWPLQQQKAEAHNKRRIGVGFLGLANAMAMLGLRYGSHESQVFAAKVAEVQRDRAYLASVSRAKKMGAFPLFNADDYLAEGTFASTLPAAIKKEIRKHGIRNSHLLSIAPTGTGSLTFGNNASSGIEPIFALETVRKIRQPDGTLKEVVVYDYAYLMLRHLQGENAKSEYLVTTADLTVDDHLSVLGAVAPYIDAAISKTVNVPTDYPFEDFAKMYMQAWKSGLKGLTAYRPNDTLQSVLSTTKEAEKPAQRTQDLVDDPDRRVVLKEVKGNITAQMRWPDRPDTPAEGKTYPIKHPQGRFAVVVNHWKNGVVHPLEVYVAGAEAPRGLAAIAKSLSVDMRTQDTAWLNMKLESLLNTVGEDAFEMPDPATGKVIGVPSLASGFARIVKHRLQEVGALPEEVPAEGASPMMSALFSRREPKTGPMGSVGWDVDIVNPVTGDDLNMHTKELILPSGQIRPYSIWLSGVYPRTLDGLVKLLSIDMRISDPNWIAMKLTKLLNMGDVRGDFLAQEPGTGRQKNYPSTVAYIAELLLARMRALKVIGDEQTAAKEVQSKPKMGHQCPSCKTMSLHKVAGCERCDHCGYMGSCG